MAPGKEFACHRLQRLGTLLLRLTYENSGTAVPGLRKYSRLEIASFHFFLKIFLLTSGPNSLKSWPSMLNGIPMATREKVAPAPR